MPDSDRSGTVFIVNGSRNKRRAWEHVAPDLLAKTVVSSDMSAAAACCRCCLLPQMPCVLRAINQSSTTMCSILSMPGTQVSWPARQQRVEQLWWWQSAAMAHCLRS